jgi:pre-mRNA-processing factor 19
VRASPHASQGDLFLTGGRDNNCAVFDAARGAVCARLTGHDKRVTDVAWHPSATTDVLFSSSADGFVRAWTPKSSGLLSSGGSGGAQALAYAATSKFRPHASAPEGVASFSIQPLGLHGASVSGAERSWAFWDVTRGETLATVPLLPVGAAAVDTALRPQVLRFHPDGVLLATGCSDAIVRIFDLRDYSQAAALGGGAEGGAATGGVQAMCFSESGIHVVSGGDGGACLWDLRKAGGDPLLRLWAADGLGAVKCLDVDATGQYVACGQGARVQVFETKAPFDVLATLALDKEAVGVAWGTDARSLAVGCAVSKGGKGLHVFSVSA